jgi:hypothetical protein
MSKITLDKFGLRREPIKLSLNQDGEAWCYEDQTGIDVHVQFPGEIGQAVVLIPLRSIRAYVRNIEKRGVK